MMIPKRYILKVNIRLIIIIIIIIDLLSKTVLFSSDIVPQAWSLL